LKSSNKKVVSSWIVIPVRFRTTGFP